MDIKRIFEDIDLLIIDKPAGITVNKSETTVNQFTVQEWAEKQLGIDFDASNGDDISDFYKRGGIVHRLDKETSGILLIAKNEHAFIELQKQFKDRTIKKIYISLVHGRIAQETGEINVPVGRLPWNRKQFGIVPGGRESKTFFKVLERFSNSKKEEQLTLVELYPQSGRTHQIRVHLKYIGHPVFSDFLYAGRKTSRKDREILPRVFLHAAGISFSHPANGKIITFNSDLPNELSSVLTSLRVS